MTPPPVFWLGLAVAGFVLGLVVRPMVLLRIGIALVMLAGLGLLLSNTWGWEGAAFWFGAGMATLGVVFGVAILGSVAGWAVRRAVHGPAEPRHRMREYNSIIQ